MRAGRSQTHLRIFACIWLIKKSKLNFPSQPPKTEHSGEITHTRALRGRVVCCMQIWLTVRKTLLYQVQLSKVGGNTIGTQSKTERVYFALLRRI